MRHNIIVNLGGKKYRREDLEGRPHLVVPCAMLREGVIAGSEGAVFYPADEIEKSVGLWNGMPIVVNHPEEDGVNVSARSKSVFNQTKVGVLLETEYDEKLRAECWFDEARVKEVDVRVYNAIVKKQKMEVSTGLDADSDEKKGKFGAEEYKFSVSNLRPDHLAILPDSIGAMSVKMGGGLFANAAKHPEGFATIMNRSIVEAVKPLGVTVSVDNELSFSDTTRAVCDLLAAKYGKPGKYWNGYIIDAYEDHVIFAMGYDGPTYRQDYSEKDDQITLSGEASEVRRVISYVTNSKEESGMPFNKKAFVNKLIANGDAAETDRDELMKTPDKILALWDTQQEAAQVEEVEEEEEVEETPAPKVKTKKVKATPKEEVAVTNSAKKLTEEEWLDTAPKSLQRIVNRAKTQEKARKDQYITKIMNSKSNRLKKEWLEEQDVDALEGMAALVPSANDRDDEDNDSPLADYSGNAGSIQNSRDDDEGDDMTPVSAPTFTDPRRKK